MGFAALYPSYHGVTAQGRTKRRGQFALRSRCAPLPRQHLDLAVAAGDHLEVALIARLSLHAMAR
jgi:hypothetical protein